nr:hypothetical protein [Nocardia sp. BMG51109]
MFGKSSAALGDRIGKIGVPKFQLAQAPPRLAHPLAARAVCREQQQCSIRRRRHAIEQDSDCFQMGGSGMMRCWGVIAHPPVDLGDEFCAAAIAFGNAERTLTALPVRFSE